MSELAALKGMTERTDVALQVLLDRLSYLTGQPEEMTVAALATADEVLDELQAGVGVLKHLAATQDVIQPEELRFVAGKLHETATRLQVIWIEKKRQRDRVTS